jgi:hypothetical protein
MEDLLLKSNYFQYKIYFEINVKIKYSISRFPQGAQGGNQGGSGGGNFNNEDPDDLYR